MNVQILNDINQCNLLQTPADVATTPLTFIDTEEALQRLCKQLKKESEIAVDLEVGHASSSSSSSHSHFYVGSMYDDIRLHVAWSCTSSADSPFSLISPLTLSYHILLARPSSLPSSFYFHFHRPPSYVVLLSFPNAHTTSASFPGLSLRFPSLSLSRCINVVITVPHAVVE